jgi:hypothetical protein
MGGDDGDAKYEAKVVEARNSLDGALTRISQASTQQQVVDSMKQASAVSTRAGNELEQADVPEQYEDENDKLTAALRSFAGDLNATAEQVVLTPDIVAGNGLSFEGWTKANQVFASLREQGLEIPALESR